MTPTFDLQAIAEAMDFDGGFDNPFTSYLNIRTGEIITFSDGSPLDDDVDPDVVDEADWYEIEAEDSPTGFEDMAAFAECVPPGALRDRLDRALARSRPFRHFKDVLFRDPSEVGREWSEFVEFRRLTRVTEWLSDGFEFGGTAPLTDAQATALRDEFADAFDAVIGRIRGRVAPDNVTRPES